MELGKEESLTCDAFVRSACRDLAARSFWSKLGERKNNYCHFKKYKNCGLFELFNSRKIEGTIIFIGKLRFRFFFFFLLVCVYIF